VNDTVLIGRQIYEAVENGVSQYPKLEGLKFTFDPKKPGGQRIDLASMFIKNEPVDLERVYKLATKPYLHEGKDGFTSLKSCPVLVSKIGHHRRCFCSNNQPLAGRRRIYSPSLQSR
jgi:2',3'-cyclic-nucleotide 2'-phosphodiesterase (5'-nucleotidase family)